MYQSTYQATEEEAIVEWLVTIGRLFRAARIVQEHNIEIGAIGELESAQFAVGDDAKAGLLLLRR